MNRNPEISVLTSRWIVTENPATRQHQIIPPGLQISDPESHQFPDGYIFRGQFSTEEEAQLFTESMAFDHIRIEFSTLSADFSGDQWYVQIGRSLRKLADEFEKQNFPHEVHDKHLRVIGSCRCIDPDSA